ncbi:hypothetical protein E3N88_42071 [Mikania micrantha]|uniref:AP180 N-terminal homology (ANTH) domain-containing protein n=1 Tax=Mikania micrantha TaxID=192012 RepID=A0A5N6LJN1_9ASTR|nr:hypothetical protein E3N88_42071 [Mikania micrantha]
MDSCFGSQYLSSTVSPFYKDGKDTQLDSCVERPNAFAWDHELQNPCGSKYWPFDLSSFKDRNPNLYHHEAFIRAYYRYLNAKASLMSHHIKEKKEGRLRKGIKEKPKQSSMTQDLVWLENLQGLLDMLLEIKPQRDNMMNVLVLEAMDCIVIEIFDIYRRICKGIATIFVRIYSIEKPKAQIALLIMKKAAVQADKLSRYVDFCMDFGVIKASETPKIVHIHEQDIRALEQLINRDSSQQKHDRLIPREQDKSTMCTQDNKHHENRILYGLGSPKMLSYDTHV